MTGQVFNLTPGSRLSLDGDVVEVAAIEGTRVTIRNNRTRQFTAMQISRRQLAAAFAAGRLSATPGARGRKPEAAAS